MARFGAVIHRVFLPLLLLLVVLGACHVTPAAAAAGARLSARAKALVVEASLRAGQGACIHMHIYYSPLLCCFVFGVL